jgi:lipopolysaccharide transport system ATP-binding protein
VASLQFNDVSVSFPLYHGASRSLKKTVFAASGRLGEDKKHRLVVEALRHLSFSLRNGDRLGFIGSNGVGKTTLLRIMAGIYEPVGGNIEVDGAITALLEGMNMELRGTRMAAFHRA